jgi:hypothetical protein
VFFAIVYIFNSFVLRAVFSVISVSILFTFCLPPVLALGMSLLLVFKVIFNLDSIVVELYFILEAIYNHSFMG